MRTLTSCPLCQSGDLLQILCWEQIPVHQNLVFTSSEAAQAAVRGKVTLTGCRRCSFTFNATFDLGLLEYGPNYDNCQAASSLFRDHQTAIRRAIAAGVAAKSGVVLEAGCGKGEFLRELVEQELPGWSGIGIDPAYTGEALKLGGRLRFIPEFFDARYDDLRADVTYSRHVIEHVSDPVPFVRQMANCTLESSAGGILLETPNMEWTLRNQAFWDISYEHCSLFSDASIRTLLLLAGAKPTSVEHVFGGQYLLVRGAKSQAPMETIAPPDAGWADLLTDFSVSHNAWIEAFRRRLETAKSRGKIAVWGAAGKGAMFCIRIDPEGVLIDRVIDNNPNKHEKHIAGTGHRIELPSAKSLGDIQLVVVMNSNYLAEIKRQAHSINPRLTIITAESAA